MSALKYRESIEQQKTLVSTIAAATYNTKATCCYQWFYQPSLSGQAWAISYTVSDWDRNGSGPHHAVTEIRFFVHNSVQILDIVPVFSQHLIYYQSPDTHVATHENHAQNIWKTIVTALIAALYLTQKTNHSCKFCTKYHSRKIFQLLGL